jgi:hypothetical protein
MSGFMYYGDSQDAGFGSGTGANAFQPVLDSVSDFGGKLSNEEKGGHTGDLHA